MSLAEAMHTFKGTFHTGVVKGEKLKPEKLEYVVPYKNYVTGVLKDLKGKALLDQLDKWVEYGTIEAEARDAIAAVAGNPEWMDLSDQYFVLLGAGAAMGPLRILLALGANIIAIDLNAPRVWENLVKLARESPGTMYFPLSKPNSQITNDKDLFASAGCNLFTQTPEIANWINSLFPAEHLVIGGYAYMDGFLHVKVALAMDAIMKSACEARKNVTLAFLCTPTDVHVVTEAAHKASHQNYTKAKFWQKLIEKLPGRLLEKNVQPSVKTTSGKELYITDGLVVEQGPNYALAKRMQHWRAMVARSEGFAVCSNVAPSTATESVVHNAQFAAAYGGIHYFRPMEIMYQQTSNAVMGALLIHDIRNLKGVAKPSTKLDSPLELFTSGAFHGGIWRVGYKFGKLGPISFMIYYLGKYKPYVLLMLALFVALFAFMIIRGPPHNW